MTSVQSNKEMELSQRGRAWAAGAAALAGIWLPAAHAAAGSDKIVYKAGLVTLCAAEGFVRVGGLNESPLPVTIEAQELSDGDKVVLLGNNSSDELRAIFPITLPANSKYVATWDLPIPAHLNGQIRPGNDRALHGSWLPKQWTDENKLAYKGTGGTAALNGTVCAVPTPTTTTIPATTTTAPAPTTTTTIAPTTTTAAPKATTTTTAATTTTATATATTVPATTVAKPLDPVQVAPAALYSTRNSRLAKMAADGDPKSEFVTQMADWAPPTWAWLTADLGQVMPLVRVDWMWSAPSAADQFSIEVSTDGVKWTTVATPGEAPVGAWNSVQLANQAQLVRFAFRNPQHDRQLGHLAEVRFFAAHGFAVTGQPLPFRMADIIARSEGKGRPATTPKLVGKRYSVRHSERSSNSAEGSSHLTLDGKTDTAWQTAMTVAPYSGWTAYDLGDKVPLGEIRWKFSKLGFADKFDVQVSDDGTHWKTLAKATNATKADTWVKLSTKVSTRYVRLYFSNPNKDANVGFVSEIRFYPPA
jgi:F5/8 type C domain